MKQIRTAAMLPLLMCGGFCGDAAVSATIVQVHELSTDIPYAGVNDVAADGTVTGMAPLDDGSSGIVRWRLGHAAERVGDPLDVASGWRTPVVSDDGAVVAVPRVSYPPGTSNTYPTLTPVIRAGDGPWQEISGVAMPATQVIGMSDDGAFLVGNGMSRIDLPHDVYVPFKPWIWSAATGRTVLPDVPGWNEAAPVAVSRDGRVVAGAAFDDPPYHYRAYGAIWTDGVPQQLLDADRRPVGQASACNSDCSIVVGMGMPMSTAGSKQAWRWTAQHGVRFLGEVAGGAPDMLYGATDTNEDGSLIVGFYHVPNATGDALAARGFVWTPAEGIADLVDFLAARGVDYGADLENLPILAMSRDGRYLLVAGVTADYRSKPAVVRIDTDAVFADGLESVGVQ